MGWEKDLTSIDLALLRSIKSSVDDFLNDNEELKLFFTKTSADDQAGA